MKATEAAMQKVDISVIIPCYNVAHYVGKTLESVFSQDHPAFEVIAVDDGSTDTTRDVLETFSQQGLRILHQPNSGAAAARNAGFAQSRGDAVLFLDGDDMIVAGHLRALSVALNGSRSDIAFGRWDRFRDDPSEASFPPRPTYQDAPPVDWIVADWLGGHPMTQCGTYLIPRAIIDQAAGWDESLSLIDDFEFFARIMTRSRSLRFAEEAGVCYRSAVPKSLSGRISRRAAQSALSSLMLGTQHLLDAEDSERTRRASAAMLAGFNFKFYPLFPDLRRTANRRVVQLGGSDCQPEGPPRFHLFRRFLGWRLARHMQHIAKR